MKTCSVCGDKFKDRSVSIPHIYGDVCIGCFGILNNGRNSSRLLRLCADYLDEQPTLNSWSGDIAELKAMFKERWGFQAPNDFCSAFYDFLQGVINANT